jgi:hypothetical protein
MALPLHRAERTDLLADGLGALLATPLPDPFAEELVAKLAMHIHNTEWYAALALCATIVPAQANPTRWHSTRQEDRRARRPPDFDSDFAARQVGIAAPTHCAVRKLGDVHFPEDLIRKG